MGLDMFIFKIKRYKNATLKDVSAVEALLDLRRYRKEHPEYHKSFKEWYGGRCETPSKDLIDFYSKFEKMNEHGFYHITEEVAYWRKANEIHSWFVENVQNGNDDCDVYREVTISDLQTLRDLCERVLADHDLAEELLPTCSGFFFGGTEYDDWYFNDLELTIQQIDKILETTDFNTEVLYYTSSW